MDVNVAEKVKHGLAAGATAAPQRPDWTMDQGWENYTPAQHAVWKTLYERQTKLLPGLACDDFVAGMNRLPMSAERIPNFEELSETLMKATGWQVVAVPGLVPEEVVFDHLANRRFRARCTARSAEVHSLRGRRHRQRDAGARQRDPHQVGRRPHPFR